MSDLKSMFRKAQANRGVASTKVQLRKLKAQKKAVRPVTPPADEARTSTASSEQAAGFAGREENLSKRPPVEGIKVHKKRPREAGPSDAELMPPPPPRRPLASEPESPPNGKPKPPATFVGLRSVAMKKESPDGIPEYFFQGGPDLECTPSTANDVVITSNPGTVPEGFFEDKEADGIARGIKPRTMKDKEAEYLDFQREIEASMQGLAEREAIDAENGARTREEVEAFEQELRFQLVSRLRDKHKQSQRGRTSGEVGKEDLGERKIKKESKMDLPGVVGDGDSDSDSVDSFTDWRAKAV